MSNIANVLQYAAAAGAIWCGLAYIYGFVLKPKGDRRLHVASLFFTGIALASLAVAVPTGLNPANAFAFLCATVFLIASVGCQSYCAFRGRRTDRRAPRTDGAGGPASAEARRA